MEMIYIEGGHCFQYMCDKQLEPRWMKVTAGCSRDLCKRKKGREIDPVALGLSTDVSASSEKRKDY